jgi:uncharacterized RDD family membrane protein YckC
MGKLASRSKRLAGYLLDLVLTVPAGILLSHLYARVLGGPRSELQVVLGVLAATTAQWGLVAWRGQTVGKILVRTRIALADGANPGFVRGVVLRAWPIFFVQWLPIVVAIPWLRVPATLIWLADVLLVLWDDRRCWHDHVAGTFVVDMRRDVGTAESNSAGEPEALGRATCTRCAATSEADAEFCTRCGAALKPWARRSAAG